MPEIFPGADITRSATILTIFFGAISDGTYDCDVNFWTHVDFRARHVIYAPALWQPMTVDFLSLKSDIFELKSFSTKSCTIRSIKDISSTPSTRPYAPSRLTSGRFNVSSLRSASLNWFSLDECPEGLLIHDRSWAMPSRAHGSTRRCYSTMSAFRRWSVRPCLFSGHNQVPSHLELLGYVLFLMAISWFFGDTPTGR